jgi:tetratricopeptide (TPR) repeat protein
MHETNQSAAEWIEEWHKTPDPTIKHYDSDNVNYPVSLARVWEQSVGRLSHSAHELMHWLVWMAPRPAGLPLDTFKTSGDWLSLRAVLSELAKASLIGWPSGADEISIHRLLQAVTRNHLSEQEKTVSLDGALTAIQAALPSPDWDQEGWRLWERLAPHCRSLLNRLQDDVLEPKGARIMNKLAAWLCDRAEPLFRRALKIDKKSLGPDHPDVARVLNNLAELLRDTKRLAEAEPLFRRALKIEKRSLGPDHPDVARVLNNLAVLLCDTNRPAEAEPLYRRALAIDEKSFGPDHPNVARGLIEGLLILIWSDKSIKYENGFTALGSY